MRRHRENSSKGRCPALALKALCKMYEPWAACPSLVDLQHRTAMEQALEDLECTAKASS